MPNIESLELHGEAKQATRTKQKRQKVAIETGVASVMVGVAAIIPTSSASVVANKPAPIDHLRAFIASNFAVTGIHHILIRIQSLSDTDAATQTAETATYSNLYRELSASYSLQLTTAEKKSFNATYRNVMRTICAQHEQAQNGMKVRIYRIFYYRQAIITNK